MHLLFPLGFACAVLYLVSLYGFRASLRRAHTDAARGRAGSIRGFAAIRLAWARRYPISEGVAICAAVTGLRVLPPIILLCLIVEAARVLF